MNEEKNERRMATDRTDERPDRTDLLLTELKTRVEGIRLIRQFPYDPYPRSYIAPVMGTTQVVGIGATATPRSRGSVLAS